MNNSPHALSISIVYMLFLISLSGYSSLFEIMGPDISFDISNYLYVAGVAANSQSSKNMNWKDVFQFFFKEPIAFDRVAALRY